MHFKFDPTRHAAIFGPSDDIDTAGPGRSRHCKTCGGWHRVGHVPHNCRPATPPRNPDLATPQIAPRFEAFRTGVLDGAEVITNRYEKSEFMKRKDLVEYDEGVGARNDWVEAHEHERSVVADLKRFHETDSENLPPDLRAQSLDSSGSLEEGTEINAAEIEVIK